MSSLTPSERIEQLTNTARAQGLEGNVSGAEATLNEAEALLTQNADSCSLVATLQFMLERGRIYHLAKTPARARPLFFEAFTLATEKGEDSHAIDAAQMMAAIESPKVKIEWTNRAVGVAEKSKDPRARHWLAALYSTLGWHYYELHQYERSLEFFAKMREALEAELRTTGEDVDVIRKIITAKWSTGKVLRIIHRLPEALKVQEELLGEVERSGRKDGLVFEELAECLTLLKRGNEAEVYFELAHAELSKDEWFSDNKPERINRMKKMGKVK